MRPHGVEFFNPSSVSRFPLSTGISLNTISVDSPKDNVLLADAKLNPNLGLNFVWWVNILRDLA